MKAMCYPYLTSRWFLNEPQVYIIQQQMTDPTGWSDVTCFLNFRIAMVLTLFLHMISVLHCHPSPGFQFVLSSWSLFPQSTSPLVREELGYFMTLGNQTLDWDPLRERVVHKRRPALSPNFTLPCRGLVSFNPHSSVWEISHAFGHRQELFYCAT